MIILLITSIAYKMHEKSVKGRPNFVWIYIYNIPNIWFLSQ